MAILPRWVRLPLPETFLYKMTLLAGTELITLSLVFNKVTGFYGLLSMLTGVRLNLAQLSMYIYSLLSLILIALLIPHIRRQSPLQCLTLAWFYLMDTLINAAYTAAFGVTWFLTVSATAKDSKIPDTAAGGGTMSDAASFTKSAGDDAAGEPSVQHGVSFAESVPSITLIILLVLIRVYFILVIMAYARQVIRQHGQVSSRHSHTDGAGDEVSENPFAVGMPLGQGWRGNLGRAMISIGKGYWLGKSRDDSWAKDLGRRFRSPVTKPPSVARDTTESERRGRTATGPTPRQSTETGVAPAG